MSWGATAYTPIRVFNNPPFGFYELRTPPDFPVCNQNPWGTSDRVKEMIHKGLREQEYKKKSFGDDKKDFEMGYDYDWMKIQQQNNLKCDNQTLFEPFSNFNNSITMYPYVLLILIIIAILLLYRQCYF